MPKKPFRDNPKNRVPRTVQSAATVLRRISQKSGVSLATAGGPPQGISLIDQWRAKLPQVLQPHLLEVLEKPGERVFFADSAAWAGRLRLALMEQAAPADQPRITVRLMPARVSRR